MDYLIGLLFWQGFWISFDWISFSKYRINELH